MTTDTFDAVIIGAGHNGLACAINLAAKGWKVAVFEAAAEAGGAVKTREVTLPGFRHDLCAMNLSLFAGSPFLRQHGEALARHGLGFVPAEDCFASVFSDGDWCGVSKTLAATLARLERLSPADAASWQRMVQRFGNDAPHIFGLLGSPMPSLAALKVIWKAWRANGSGWLIDMARFLVSSPRSWLDANFASDKVKATLAAWGMHLDFAPDIAGGALFPYLESMASQSFGMVIGQGGADTMIRAMTGYLAELGGSLSLSAPVRAVEVASGRAAGVVLADGRRIVARRAVVANVPPAILFGRLLPEGAVDDELARKFAAFRPGPGTMMIHLALDAPLAWAAGGELSRFAYVHLAPSLEQMARTYQQATNGLLPSEPVLVVGQPTALDPTRAPDGKHILWVQVRVLPKRIAGDAASVIVARDWSMAGELYADRAAGIIEHYAPGFTRSILARSVLTPDDLEAENPCLVGGDNLSGSHHLDQNFLFRPVAGHSRYRMPVNGLYMCGAATWPGAGTGAGSGHMLGQMLTRRA